MVCGEPKGVDDVQQRSSLASLLYPLLQLVVHVLGRYVTTCALRQALAWRREVKQEVRPASRDDQVQPAPFAIVHEPYLQA